MKLTLAFQVYNKEEYIESVMDSWVTNLSGRNEYEIIVVFDDCKDKSVEILHRYLREKKQDYMFLFTDDRYEIFCNNLALKHASGDYIVFKQDDNWIYDENWDLLLGKMLPECEFGIWQIDSVCRPFCISRELLLSYGGMDGAFSPTRGDDLDLGIKLLKEGFTN